MRGPSLPHFCPAVRQTALQMRGSRKLGRKDSWGYLGSSMMSS